MTSTPSRHCPIDAGYGAAGDPCGSGRIEQDGPLAASVATWSKADEGDRSSAVHPSFRFVYDHYFDFVWTCARRLGVPMDAIDDVVQEIFIVVHSRLHTLEQPASLRSWLYGVVRRTVSTYHRARNTRAARELSEPTLDDSSSPVQPSPLDLAVLNDELKLLWRLLGEVEARKREVLVLAELEEMTMPEIAEAIGIPLNTAYSRLRAARSEFNVAFSRYRAQKAGG